MQTFFRLALFLGLIACAIAASPKQLQRRGVFKVERIRNPNFQGHNGPKQLAKAYAKYNVPLPPALLDAVRNSDTTSAASAPATEDKILGLDMLEGLLGGGKGKKDQGDAGKAAGAAKATVAAASAAAPKATKVTKVSAAASKATKASAAVASKATKASAAVAASKATKASSAVPKATKAPAAAQGGNSTQPAAATLNGSGLVTATPEQGDVEYIAPVTIGGQVINMDFDSGSSDLWVFNTQLKANETTGHTLYDPTKSKTLKMIQGASFKISYGDGSGASGNVGTDTVSIGGAVVPAQAVELATVVSQSFVQDTQNNGLVGLAFSKINTVKPQQQQTFFDNVKGNLAEPVFTADLRSNAVGAYEFGRVDTSKFVGQMTYIPINTTQGFWQFPSTKFAVGTGAVQTANPVGQAIADTGTTLILADPTVVTAYYAQVEGATNDAASGGVTFPCSSILPDLMLDCGGHMARVNGTFINFTKVSAQSTTCFGGLQALAGGLSIYGDIFFKSQFVAFNGGNNSLGLAQHA